MRRAFLLLALLGMVLGGCGGVEWFPEPGVVAFSFTPASVVDVAAGSEQTTPNPVTVKINGTSSANISVSGGEYSINGGEFKTAAGTVNNNETVTVRHTASSVGGQTTTTTLLIGDKSATFSSTTALPLVFAEPLRLNVAANSTQTSSPLIVSLASSPATISVTNGQYQIGTGPFTSEAGVVSSGQQVTVRHTAANGTTNTTVITTLTVGNSSTTFASSTGAVATQRVALTAKVGLTAEAQVPVLVSGSHVVSVQEGFGEISIDNNTFWPVGDPQTFTLSAGQPLYFHEIASTNANTAVTTIVKVGELQTITFVTTATP
jgi:hypothetical protein